MTIVTIMGGHVTDRVVAEFPQTEFIDNCRLACPFAAPTMRDCHLQIIADHGRMAWQKAAGYNWRALVEAATSHFKRVISDGLRSRTDRRRATEAAIAVNATKPDA